MAQPKRKCFRRLKCLRWLLPYGAVNRHQCAHQHLKHFRHLRHFKHFLPILPTSHPQSDTARGRRPPLPAMARRSVRARDPVGRRRSAQTRGVAACSDREWCRAASGRRFRWRSARCVCVTAPSTASSISLPTPASVRRCCGNMTRIMAASAPLPKPRPADRARSHPSCRRSRLRHTPGHRSCRSRCRTNRANRRTSHRAAR